MCWAGSAANCCYPDARLRAAVTGHYIGTAVFCLVVRLSGLIWNCACGFVWCLYECWERGGEDCPLLLLVVPMVLAAPVVL